MVGKAEFEEHFQGFPGRLWVSIFGNLLGLWRSLGVFGDLWGFDLLKVRLFSSHARCDFLVFSCKVHKTFWFLIQDEIWVFLSYMRLLGFLILHKTFCPRHQKPKTNNPFDQVWTNFVYFWTNVLYFEQVWSSLNMFEDVWSI